MRRWWSKQVGGLKGRVADGQTSQPVVLGVEFDFRGRFLIEKRQWDFFLQRLRTIRTTNVLDFLS